MSEEQSLLSATIPGEGQTVQELIAERDALRDRVEGAKDALYAEGYFSDDDRIDDDIAPRIIELTNFRLGQIEKLCENGPNPFHAPSETPDEGREVFMVWKCKIMERLHSAFYISSDTSTFKQFNIFSDTVEKQWAFHRDFMEDDTVMLAWAYSDELEAFFMGMFYHTPQPVLDYIDTWNEPTGTTNYELTGS